MTQDEFFKKYYNCTAEEYNWENSHNLVTNHLEHIDIWMCDKFPKSYHKFFISGVKQIDFTKILKYVDMTTYTFIYLIRYQYKNFLIWWDPILNDRIFSKSLCCMCANYIKYWYDSDKFDWENCSKHLKEHCEKNKEIWLDDYLIRQII